MSCLPLSSDHVWPNLLVQRLAVHFDGSGSDKLKHAPQVNYRYDELPAEILRYIFSCLSGRDLARCMSVCRRWRIIAGDQSLWRLAYSRQFPHAYRRLLRETSEKKTAMAGQAPPHPLHWRVLYTAACLPQDMFSPPPSLAAAVGITLMPGSQRR